MGLHGGNLREAIERYRLGNKEIIDFSANINPLGPPRNVKKIIFDNIGTISHYPDLDCKVLKEMLAQYLNINKDNLLIGNGSMELIFLLALALKPKRVLIPIPTFSEYARAVALAGGRCLFLKSNENNNFEIKVTEIVKHLNSVDLLFVCNPNNPTGFLFDKEAIQFLIDNCESKGIFLVIDEVFMDFVKKKNELSMVRVAAGKGHILVLQSLTKFFALAGLRLGYLVGDKTLLKNIFSYQPPWSVNSLAQLVGCEVIKDISYLKKSREYVLKEREFLFKELAEIKFLKPYPPSANFIFCKLENLKVNSGKPPHPSGGKLCAYCGSKGILIRDCSNFRGLDNRFIRIAVRRREENKKLIKVLKDYAKAMNYEL